jgi:sterol desaturase/sphingolipid hydroxylase (fatty acid hydroxylase superfamily)
MAERILREMLLVLGLGAPFFLLERWFAAHRVSYRRVLPGDVGAYFLVVVLGIPAGAVMSALHQRFPVVAAIRRAVELPPWASIPLAILASDLAIYWVHRLIHTRPFWRIHRWHHSPGHMYWLAGARASVLQGMLYSIFPLIFVALSVPVGFIAGYGLFMTLVNHWMHSNLRLRSRWLEAVLVTPRIHHIHHSCDPRHHGRNFGSIFSIWDRMFGTFFDPDDVRAPLDFGIPEVVSPPRMVLGV